MGLIETLSKVVNEQGGFLLRADIAEIASLDRLRPVLVRCGACRFTCAAQDAQHLVDIVTRENSDYVRDISLLASDEAYGLRALKAKPAPAPAPAKPDPIRTEVQYFDSILGTARLVGAAQWDETQCGGTWDGFNVGSDADPGL
jgi:hypothetical protein